MIKSNSKSKKNIYFIILAMMIVTMCVFINSFYWPYKEISKRKVLVGIIVCVCVFIVPLLMVKIKMFYAGAIVLLNHIADNITKLKKRKRRVSLLCIIIISGGLFLHILTWLLSEFVWRDTYNVRFFYTLLVLFGIGFFYSLIWSHAAQKVEKLFFVTALCLGLFCIGVTPSRVGVSWDDEIHYARTLEVSNFLNGIMYEADEKNIQEYANNIYAHAGYDRKTNAEFTQELDALYNQKKFNTHDFKSYGVWTISYLPSALGIILARGLELSYVSVFNMGRFFNLLAYTLLSTFAIRRVRFGKVLIAAVGLMPTSIFMASCYSYDWWVTGFTILGFAYFFAELQTEDKIKKKNMMIIIGSIVLGCIPKQIYFPILFPLLFMPKKKFETSKQRKWYYFTIIGAGIFLVATFMLPMLFNGPGGDLRGGTDVNSVEQIKFILQNPLSYMKILTKFLLDYIAVSNSSAMLQRFAYVGNGYFYSIVGLMLFLLAFLDRDQHEKHHYIIKGAGLIGCAVAIVLSTTALYISFTAVGSNTVAGMQARYLVPTILPALYSLGAGGITHRFNKNTFVCVPMLIISLTFIANMFRFCVLCY